MPSNVTLDDYPLLPLFNRLREAGLPLGLGEYRLLLQALQGGYGLPDRAALKRLCCCLWIKSPEEQAIFEHHFERAMADLALPARETVALRATARELIEPARTTLWRYLFFAGACSLLVTLPVGLWTHPRPAARFLGQSLALEERLTPETEPWIEWIKSMPSEPLPNESEPDIETPSGKPPNESEPDIVTYTALPPMVLATEPSQTPPPWWFWGSIVALGGVGLWWHRQQRLAARSSLASLSSSVLLSPQLIQAIDDEAQVAQMARQAASGQPKQRFPQRWDYAPLTRRQMKQSWRYLRCSTRQGPPAELDVKATVARIGQQGGLLQPVLVPRRRNRTELLLLIDSEGSMVPFGGLVARLVETAQQAGRLGRVTVYYFHNCPRRVVYGDAYSQDAVKLETLLAQQSPRYGLAMLVSDGGALRGGFNPQRGEQSLQFWRQLQAAVRAAVWLNPMPASRWTGTTAGSLAQQLLMFEASRAGFQAAIDALRRGSEVVVTGRLA